MGLLLTGCGGSMVEPNARCAPDGFETHPHQNQYSALLQEYCRASASPGCIVFVDRPREALWAGSTGFSNLSTGAPMCTSTPMRIGSISKTYIAALIMKLVDEGALSLDTRLADVLPEVVGRIPSADGITVKQLLAHTSGVLNPETQDLFAQTDYFDRPDQPIPLTLEQRMERYVYDRPLLFPPGTARRYSNPGYDLLG